MRILFIYPVPPEDRQMLRYQQGIGSISAVLKQGGHETALLTINAMDRGRIEEAVRGFRPDLAAFSITSNFFPLAREAAAFLHDEHRLPVVLGGIHPTLRPEESIAAPGVFAICVGEGEHPMLELCDALAAGRDPSGIRNLWVRHDGEVRRNPLRPLITDLDALPFPDRDLFDFNRLLRQFPEAEFMGSRGCPYRCAYCANHALVQLYRGKGRYVRYRSVDNLLAEIEQVLALYKPIEWLGFHDDTLTLNPNWLREFAEKFPARIGARFWCNSTARAINEDTAELLRRAGCYEVRLGVESGNDHIRMEVLEKKVTREEIVRAFKLLKEAGIRRYAFNMIGLPFETPATMEDTLRLNQEIRPDEVFCSVFYPYPGTRAEDICREHGWISDRSVRSYFDSDTTLNQPGIDPRRVAWFHEIFRDCVRWPRWSPVIKLMHRIPVTRTKTLWNAFRRVRAKVAQLAARWPTQSRRAAPGGAEAPPSNA